MGELTHSWRELWKEYRGYVLNLLWLSWPNILTSLVQLSLPTSTTFAVGRLGSSQFIGASALGNMFANATGFAVGAGLSMALDTLCSQAFGAKKYRLVGLHCQRAMAILTIACVPVALLWYNAWFILQFIGSKETAELSQFYIRRFIPSLWPRLMYEAYRRYLLSQKVMWPMTLSICIVIPFHVLNTYLFMYYFELGFEGAPYASSLSYWLLFGTLVLVSKLRLMYLRRKKVQYHQKLDEYEPRLQVALDGVDELEAEWEGDELNTWPPWSKDVFRGWPGFLRLGVATTASLFIEWGSFEVNAAIASKISEASLAAHAIMSNIVGIWYAFPIGIASATSAVVGNMLGAGDAEKAKIYTRIAFVLVVCWGLLNGGIGMTYRHVLGRAFTDDDAVVQLIAATMPVLWLYGTVDAVKAVGMAVLRGCGRPSLTVLGNVLSCIVIGYPIAFCMAFLVGMKLPGVWLGMSSAWLSAGCIYLVFIARTDWAQQVLNAAKRNAEALLSTKHGKELASQGQLMEVLTEKKEEEEEGEETEKFSVTLGEDGEDEKASFLTSTQPPPSE